jgi:hypothetical protein
MPELAPARKITTAQRGAFSLQEIWAIGVVGRITMVFFSDNEDIWYMTRTNAFYLTCRFLEAPLAPKLGGD